MKFCQHCGEKRVANARYCVGCGETLVSDPGPLIPTVGAVVICSLIIFAVVRFGVLNKPAASPVVDEHAGHNHATQADAAADHSGSDDPKLKMLLAHAEGGTAGALLDLAEYQAQMGHQNRDFLFQAAQTMERFVSSWPDHPYALRLLGNIYFDSAQPEKSVAFYQRYLAAHPDDANVLTDLGTQLLQLGQFEQALEAYQKALDLFPNFYNAYFNMNIAYAQMGNQAKATESLDRANQIASEYGKLMPPFKNLTRLPEGAPVSPNEMASAGAPATTSATQISAAGRYAELEKFFRNHAIIGPKVVGFDTVDDKAILKVRQFPMDQIPESMRGSLDAKIKNQLAQAGAGATLDIMDADSRKVMGSYQID